MSGVRDFSEDFMVENAAPAGRRRAPGGVPPGAPPPALERETDPHRLAQRQKQIDLGKNTLGYQRYRQAVPRDRRNRKNDPMTPDVYQVCSKRAFDGQVKKWRRMLHAWDLPEDEQQGAPAVLPVHADTAGPATNPLAPERSDDFEHISYSDVAAADGDPKNGRLLRPADTLPLKIPSAMRKRGFDATMADGEARQPQQENLQANSAQPAQGGPPGAKALRRSVDGEGSSPGGARAAGAAAAAARKAQTPVAAQREPTWAEQRYTDPQLDYGTEDEDEEWQRVERPGQERLPGQYKAVFNNVHNNSLAWEDEIQI